MYGIKPLLLLILGVLFSASAFGSKKEALLWCVDDIPIRHYYVKGIIKGPTVDFMQAVAANSGFALRNTPDTPFSRCLKKMQTGEADLMMALNKNDDRSQYMHFFPVYQARSETLFVNAQNLSAFSNLSDVKNKSVSTISGYLYNTSNLGDFKKYNQIVSAYSVEDALALLVRGKVDLVLAPHFSTLARVQSNPLLNQKIQALPIKLNRNDERYVHLAISKHAGLPETQIETIRAAVQSLKQSGEAEKILFPSAIKSLQ